MNNIISQDFWCVTLSKDERECVWEHNDDDISHHLMIEQVHAVHEVSIRINSYAWGGLVRMCQSHCIDFMTSLLLWVNLSRFLFWLCNFLLNLFYFIERFPMIPDFQNTAGWPRKLLYPVQCLKQKKFFVFICEIPMKIKFSEHFNHALINMCQKV